MPKRLAIALLYLFLAAPCCFAQGPAVSASQPPKIRTVTAFVRLDRATWQAQVSEALKMLQAAKDALTKAGYEVETICIIT